jgi:glycosyltransferase involved in cell wall biosynthesis
MAPPVFSIVIPTYNRSELVQGAVRSILHQTFEDLEVVVSDNGSTDDTRDVVGGFQDPRVRYVRTPTHTAIADSWEFARTQARGTLVMMLSDDDALVQDALDRFFEQHTGHDADFMFCNLAEYRDRSFGGPQANTVNCRPFTGSTRVVSTNELLKPLFAFRPAFNMHPSAYVFASRLAGVVVQRCGRFFTTNGVEYFAWPLAAVFSKRMVYLDAPLVILGRTVKSWGSALVLINPGKEQIDRMIADNDHNRGWVPLKNFTLTNLMAEGLLLGKKLFPEELAPYPFEEQQYLRRTMRELMGRQSIGVDVTREICELMTYADAHPALKAELLAVRSNGSGARWHSVRRLARTLGLDRVRQRVDLLQENRKVARGDVKAGFTVSGDDFGFDDALGCAVFISRVTEARRTSTEA